MTKNASVTDGIDDGEMDGWRNTRAALARCRVGKRRGHDIRAAPLTPKRYGIESSRFERRTLALEQ